MEKYLKEYISNIDEKLKGNITNQDIEKHLTKITFFQHERLIHLLVTLFYAIFLFISVFISFKIPLFLIISFILIIFLLFYVKHYFFLENGVQYLYKQYDEMVKKRKN